MKKLILLLGLVLVFPTLDAKPKFKSKVAKYKSFKYKKKMRKRGNRNFKNACKYTDQWKIQHS